MNIDPMDFLTVILTVGGIIAAYLVAENVYHREKSDKKVEDLSIQYSENELLINNVKSIVEPINKQVIAIEEYLDKKNYNLKFYPEIQVDFLQFINIKEIYKKHGLQNKDEIKAINKLMTNLFTIYDFRESLRSEVRTYIKKYNYHEQKFYSYRRLLYNKYYELCNLRATNIENDGGIKKFQFDPRDEFMANLTKLRLEIFQDEEVIKNGVLVSREKLNEKFIIPIIHLSDKYIPEDINAIEVNELANEINSAFIDMQEIDERHKNALIGHKESLKTVKNHINEFLKLN